MPNIRNRKFLSEKNCTDIFSLSAKEKSSFIEEMKDDYSIDFMCKTLKIPRRSFYDQLSWTKPPRQTKSDALDEKIREIFYENKKSAGSSDIHRILDERGISTTQQTVWRHMKRLGLLEQFDKIPKE